MWRSIVIGVVLAGLLAGCSLGGGSDGAVTIGEMGVTPSPFNLVTRHSLGGVKLGQTERQVERLIGSGHLVPKQGVREVIYHASDGGVIVDYGSLFENDPRPTV